MALTDEQVLTSLGKRQSKLSQRIALELSDPLLAQLENVGDRTKGHFDVVDNSESSLQDVSLARRKSPQRPFQNLKGFLSNDRLFVLEGFRVGDEGLEPGILIGIDEFIVRGCVRKKRFPHRMHLPRSASAIWLPEGSIRRNEGERWRGQHTAFADGSSNSFILKQIFDKVCGTRDPAQRVPVERPELFGYETLPAKGVIMAYRGETSNSL